MRGAEGIDAGWRRQGRESSAWARMVPSASLDCGSPREWPRERQAGQWRRRRAPGRLILWFWMNFPMALRLVPKHALSVPFANGTLKFQLVLKPFATKEKAPSPSESHAILAGSKTSMVPTRLKEQSESRVVLAGSKTAETTTHAKYRRRTMSFRPVPKPMPSVSAHGLAFRLRTSREKNRLRASTTLRRKASYRSPRASIPATAAVLNRILLQRASARGAPIAFRPIFPRSGQATGVASGRRPRPFLAAG